MLSVRRLYKLSQDAQIKEYMSWFDFHEKSNRFRKQDDLTEKQVGSRSPYAASQSINVSIDASVH